MSRCGNGHGMVQVSEFLKSVKLNVRIREWVVGNVRFQFFLTLLHRRRLHLYKFRSCLLLLSLRYSILSRLSIPASNVLFALVWGNNNTTLLGHTLPYSNDPAPSRSLRNLAHNFFTTVARLIERTDHAFNPT